MTVKDQTLYLFGGIFEDEEKQITLNDFWKVDLKRMNGWSQINEADEFGSNWEETMALSSSSSEMDSEEEQIQKPKKRRKKQDKSQWRFGKIQASSIYDSNHPSPITDEDFQFYFSRTEDYWNELMYQTTLELDEDFTEDQQKEAAETMAKAFHKQYNKNT